MATLNEIKTYLIDLQQNICTALETVDGKAKFISDKWTRAEGGGGDTRVISNGNVYEKGGVNFSHVFGKLPEVIKTETTNANFFDATGVSIVIHTQNPFVPIIHMNVRYFQMKKEENSNEIVDCWFGGGIDLSPAYPNEVDTKYFHEQLKAVCDKHDSSYYEKFKPWCDDYFTIQHRNEMRGVSGIFYDHLRPNETTSKSQFFEFMQSVGNAFAPIYTEISNRNKEKTYTKFNKEWQMIRRGRYAEFNLVYDRGTSFGLKSNGRVESILMSLPPQAIWQYNQQPLENSEEAKALAFFQPKNWIS
ncbi:MAG: oxygen-dependent coproporphyrinogen oxidase [Chitinophagales bacterium]|nr:oxygen-dependent coproporphyrinogen oxidase [Chitinophagales bacterium]